MNTGQNSRLDALATAVRAMHARGWVPATSGNFSIRLDPENIAVTSSGKDKATLGSADFLRIKPDGNVLGHGKPSAETALHLQLYRRDPGIGVVLHTHSMNATLVSMAAGENIELAGFELLKAFSGIETHATSIIIPVFPNTQDIDQLAVDVDAHMERHGSGVGYLIQGHGMYTWGSDLQAALQHIEALEFLLDCHRNM